MRISKELADIGFHKYQIEILESLEKGKKTASQISKEKNIPMGRIYEFLADLDDKEIISHTTENPSCYYSKNTERNILNYLDSEYLKLGEKQRKLLSMLEAEELEVEPLYSRKPFIEAMNRERETNTKTLKIIRRDVSYPFFFYPGTFEETEPLRIRLHNRPKDYYKNKEIKNHVLRQEAIQGETFAEKDTRIIFSEFTLRYFFNKMKKYFGEKKAKEHLKKVKKSIENRPTLELRVSKERFPYHLLISEMAIVLGVKVEKEDLEDTVGTLMKGGEIVKKYTEIFDEKFKASEPFNSFCDKLMKEIRQK